MERLCIESPPHSRTARNLETTEHHLAGTLPLVWREVTSTSEQALYLLLFDLRTDIGVKLNQSVRRVSMHAHLLSRYTQ